MLHSGDMVQFTEESGNWPRVQKIMCVESSEKHNGLTFYRVKELPGALFLQRSLRKV